MVDVVTTITVDEPPNWPAGKGLELRTGQAAKLTGKPSGGAWSQNGNLIAPAPGDSLVVFMHPAGKAPDHTGTYTYRPAAAGAQAAAIEVDRRGHWYDIFTNKQVFALGAILVVYAAPAVALVHDPFGVHWATPKGQTVRSYCFAALTLAAFLSLIEVIGRLSSTGSGLRSLFTGADLRLSTSKFQALMWTFLVGTALAYITSRSMISNTAFQCVASNSKNCVPTGNWDAYLVLLGLPAGAAVVAKGLVSYKVTNGVVQKPPASGPNAGDLTTDDNGDSDIVDIQYLLFNLIAFAYVAGKFVGNGTLPEIPALLLGLTSTAAGTYVLNKSLQGNAPSVTSVRPSVIGPGTPVTVTGTNLTPDANISKVTVKIGGAVLDNIDVNNGIAKFEAPVGMNAQDSTVSIITSVNVETDPYTVTINAPDAPAVLGWQDQAPSAGKLGHLVVDGLPANLDQRQLHVSFHGVMGNVLAISGTDVTVKVPETAPNPVAVVASYGGKNSASVQLALT